MKTLAGILLFPFELAAIAVLFVVVAILHGIGEAWVIVHGYKEDV